MTWKIKDLSLAATSVIENVRDSASQVTLDLYVSPAERVALQEMFEQAGLIADFTAPLSGRETVDNSPGGQNTFYLTSDAPTVVDEGWLVCEEVLDDQLELRSHVKLTLLARRIAGPHNARGAQSPTVEHLANDFSITDAKTQTPLPTGASNIRKSDGTLPTVRYVPVGPNLLTNPDFETDLSGWTVSGGTWTRDATKGKVGSASAKVVCAAGGNILSQTFATVPGATYLVDGWVETSGMATGDVTLKVRRSDGSSYDASDVILNPGTKTWFRLSGTFTAIGTTHQLFLQIDNATAGEIVWFDTPTIQACVPVVQSPFVEPATVGTFAGGSVTFDPAGGAHYAGDVKVFDMGAQTSASLSESSYTRVYGTRHSFVGGILLDNGVVRVALRRDASPAVSVFANGSWQSQFNVSPDTAGDASSSSQGATLVRAAPGEAVVDVAQQTGNLARFTLARGSFAIRVDTTRVVASSAWQDFEVGAGPRFVAYAGRTVMKDHSVTSTQATASGNSLIEPVVIGLSPTTSYLTCLAMTRKPSTLYHDAAGNILWRDTAATTAAFKRTFWVGLIPWPWMLGLAMYGEAEAMTRIGPTPASVTADGDASGGQGVLCTANSDGVRRSFVPASDVPLGDYTVVARVKDSGALTTGVTIKVSNATDATTLVTTASTAGSAFGFITADVSIGSTDSGDTLNLEVYKSNAGASNVVIDEVLLIPRKRNSSTPSHIFFPIDVARNLIMNVQAREAIQRA